LIKDQFKHCLLINYFSVSGPGLLVTTQQVPLGRLFINSKESNAHGNLPLEDGEEEDWTRPILRQH
jgi:hypothetical protein